MRLKNAISYEDMIRPTFAGRVTRYHTWPMLQRQSVGEHSARVAMIYVKIYGLPRAEVLHYCLAHDLGEMHSGDVPYHAKRYGPDLKRATNESEDRGLDMMGVQLPHLSTDEWNKFKTCDLLELYEHCRIDVLMGNALAQPCCDTVVGALNDMWGEEDALELVTKIEEDLPQWT